MPRRVESDDDDVKPKKNTKPMAKTSRKFKSTSRVSKSYGKKGQSVNNEAVDSMISAWAKRQTVDNLDGIEDVNSIPPQKATRKPVFEILDDIERVPAVGQLAVHKRKIAEVSNWFKGFPHHGKKLLVLSGPAGAGKSTTVQSLAKEFGITIVEWINPVDETKLAAQKDEIESLSRKFSTFLRNSQRYASLEGCSNQIILIQDLPNTIGSSPLVSQARQAFHSSIKEFLASSRVRYPVVLIVTESEVGSGEDFGYSSTFGEGLTVKGLLGGDILNDSATTHIMFNAIAKTIMLRAMASMSSLKHIPKALLASIIEISAGDIRSAINCSALVAFQCMVHSNSIDDRLAGLECREGGLDLFHASGRVIYNKRYGDEPDDPSISVPSLPPHLKQWDRRASKVDIDDLLASVQSDSSILHSLIHQNFPQSCFCPEDIDAVLSVLSDTDCLFPRLSGIPPLQERLAAHYSVGGVLLALPSPVAKRTDHKLRWPESSRLPKRVRDAKERFMQCLDDFRATTSNREDLLLDVLPFLHTIDQLSAKVKNNLQILCGFPLRGRVTVEEPMEDLKLEEVVIAHSGGWLIDDDIED